MDHDLARLRHEDPDRFAREYVTMQLAADRVFKRDITTNGPDDLPSRVVYMAEREEGANLILPAQLGAGPVATPVELVGFCCNIAREQFGPPFMIGFLAEAYMQLFSKEEQEAALRLRRGQITEAYARGNPAVRECLGITVMHRRLDGSLRSIGVHQPYRYEGGSVVFDDEQWVDSLDDDTVTIGALPEAMAAAFGGEQN